MKRFESFLAPRLEEYLAYRRTLGYVDEHLRSCLRTFDRYVKEKATDQHSLNPLFFSHTEKRTQERGKNREQRVVGRARIFPISDAPGPLSGKPLAGYPASAGKYLHPLCLFSA